MSYPRDWKSAYGTGSSEVVWTRSYMSYVGSSVVWTKRYYSYWRNHITVKFSLLTLCDANNDFMDSPRSGLVMRRRWFFHCKRKEISEQRSDWPKKIYVLILRKFDQNSLKQKDPRQNSPIVIGGVGDFQIDHLKRFQWESSYHNGILSSVSVIRYISFCIETKRFSICFGFIEIIAKCHFTQPLTFRGLNRMADILRTTFPNALSWEWKCWMFDYNKWYCGLIGD